MMKTIRIKTIKAKKPLTCLQAIFVFVIFIVIILLLKWVNNIDVLRKVMYYSNQLKLFTKAQCKIFAAYTYNTKLAGNKFTNSRLVWPDELPIGDRIREQMSYVPKGYQYDTTPIKRILVDGGIGEDWERFKLDQGEFIGCPVSQCWLTADKSLGSEVDAILFRQFYKRPQYERPPNQIWIMEYTESPPYTEPFKIDFDVFNWTATYRWDSDIPLPYGYFMEHRPPLPQKRVDFPKTKTKKVAWFVSNCKTNSHREVYAKDLAKYIDVDVYGGCGNLECPTSNETKCFEMLETDYKFYLSFENSLCRHYITEKLFLNALSHNVVPIVMGPSREDYELVAPKNSFIHVDDFASPEQLAAYLHKLDKNDRLYEEYFQWKHTGTVVSGLYETRFYCRLCAMLHDADRPIKHYVDIDAWWRADGICRPHLSD